MSSKLLTVIEAANLKGVTRNAVYAAIRDGRLHHQKVLGHFALREADVLAWTLAPYSGRRKGTKLSKESKERISQSQKQRWQKRQSE